MTSPILELATEVLGEPVSGWVLTYRREGESWDAIARRLYVRTGQRVDLSGELLRRHFREHDPAVDQPRLSSSDSEVA